jgi:DNA polymerase
VPVSAEAIARMDWEELKTTAAKCTRCALSRTRRAVVFGRGDARAALMVLASAPGRADEREGVAIGGEAGVLLQNMLRASGFAGGTEVSGYYVSHLVKCRPSGGEGAERAPAPEELAACRPYLERELALTGARTVVTLGHPALRGLLGAGVPAARGAVQHVDADARSVAVVATYHPADLLRQGENKAGAWADLVLARETHGAGPA